jgi:hypothetical protein
MIKISYIYYILPTIRTNLTHKGELNIKTRKAVLILAASLLVVGLAFGAFQSVYAQDAGPGDFDPFGCDDAAAPWPWYHNCYWDVEMCNEASGNMEVAGSPFDPNSIPVSVAQLAANWGIDHAKCNPGWDGMKDAGKCKLTEIDSEIYLGTPFEAKWIGRGGHLRFIKPSGEFNYIAKVEVSSGTVMQDGREYVGLFSARGKVEPGVYTVQCFGPGGTAGLGIQNVEVVGH